MKRLFIKINGIVQGVGFRPYVYKNAVSRNLKGWVNNSSDGVFIDIQGNPSDLDSFLNHIKTTPPPLAKITSFEVEKKSITDYKDFDIRFTSNNQTKNTLISPDICTCTKCMEDVLTAENRRYKYAFTNCTDCGPRYSIIKDIPYDRPYTTMNSFPMCHSCSHEYSNPMDRRFHAQPNACSICGPQLWIEKSAEGKITCEDPLEFTINKLQEGFIFGIKGLGGFHLCCDALNHNAINNLRTLKHRPHKPFAIMVDSLETIKEFYTVSSKEESLLRSKESPIVILEKKDIDRNLFPDNLAPNVHTIGVMLPYTPLHKLLFQDDIKALVMTSGNVSSLPLEYTNDGARDNLSELCDYFLMHNRDIHIPVDDSIMKIVDDREIILRRARGFTPLPFELPSSGDKNILALGPNMKNTFSFTTNKGIIMSQYNGNLFNHETITHFERNLQHLQRIFDFQPDVIVCDKHPNYYTSIRESKVKKIKVQHHHAHILSCMSENQITNDEVIGVAFDGTGYGDDGAIWGGEFLICSTTNFKRAAYLDYMTIAGGESAIKSPWKIALSYLLQTSKKDADIDLLKDSYKKEIISAAIKNNINTFKTSSIGRLFDCISALLSICHHCSYEGQAAIELESALYRASLNQESYPIEFTEKHNQYRISQKSLVEFVVDDILNGIPKEDISLKFHNSVVMMINDICVKIRNDINLNKVCLSGGVFQNSYILKNTCNLLKNNGFQVYTQSLYPCNDGGISLGQTIYAVNSCSK